MRNESGYRGFTLIEMMVGLAIIACIVTMVYGSYAATTRTLDVYQSRMAGSERVQLVLRLMARQIRCAHIPPSSKTDSPSASPGPADDKATVQSPSRDGLAKPRRVLFQGDALERRGEILRFVTTGNPSLGSNHPAAPSLVTYRYDKASGVLSLGGEARPLHRAQESADWTTILSGVTSVSLDLHDGQRWQHRWDSQETRRLPQAARIALTLADESGRAAQYEIAAPIICQAGAREQPRKVPTKRP